MTVNSSLRWRPGQHVFVRFPGLAPLSAHPFTIVSMPSMDEHQLVSTVVLMARSSQRHHEASLRTSIPGPSEQVLHHQGGGRGLVLSAILDGPMGNDASVASHSDVLLLAGGSGITFVLASLLELSWLWQKKACNDSAGASHMVDPRMRSRWSGLANISSSVAALAPSNTLKNFDLHQWTGCFPTRPGAARDVGMYTGPPIRMQQRPCQTWSARQLTHSKRKPTSKRDLHPPCQRQPPRRGTGSKVCRRRGVRPVWNGPGRLERRGGSSSRDSAGKAIRPQ